jgi:hypothetical protein
VIPRPPAFDYAAASASFREQLSPSPTRLKLSRT